MGKIEKDIKQEYIKMTEDYVPATKEDRIKLKKAYKRYIINICLMCTFVILTLPLTIMKIHGTINNGIFYEVSENSIIDIFAFLLVGLNPFLIGMIILFSTSELKIRRENLKKENIRIIRGVVDGYHGARWGRHTFTIDDNAFSINQYAINIPYPGWYIEIRFNPFSFRRLDDEWYDYNYIKKTRYLKEIDSYKTSIAKYKEKLIKAKDKKLIIEIEEKIVHLEKIIKFNKKLISSLPIITDDPYYEDSADKNWKKRWGLK